MGTRNRRQRQEARQARPLGKARTENARHLLRLASRRSRPLSRLAVSCGARIGDGPRPTFGRCPAAIRWIIPGGDRCAAKIGTVPSERRPKMQPPAQCCVRSHSFLAVCAPRLEGAGFEHRLQLALAVGRDFLAREQAQELFRRGLELIGAILSLVTPEQTNGGEAAVDRIAGQFPGPLIMRQGPLRGRLSPTRRPRAGCAS